MRLLCFYKTAWYQNVTYRKDDIENEEDIFADDATSVYCHDVQRCVLV